MLCGDRLDRNQGQAEVAHLADQPVQRCLVDHWSLQERGAISSVTDGHTIEPRRPVRVKLLFDLNTIASRHRYIPLQYCSGVLSRASWSQSLVINGRVCHSQRCKGRESRSSSAKSCMSASTPLS